MLITIVYEIPECVRCSDDYLSPTQNEITESVHMKQKTETFCIYDESLEIKLTKPIHTLRYGYTNRVYFLVKDYLNHKYKNIPYKLVSINYTSKKDSCLITNLNKHLRITI